MSFSLINGCSTLENNIRGHPFVWSGTCEFTKYYNCYKKSKKCKEKFVILQYIWIIAIKSSEAGQSSTPADIPVGIFNTYNSANELND